MPQMSPLLWTMIIISTVNLLLTISSFLYFMNLPSINITPPYSFSTPMSHFTWTW